MTQFSFFILEEAVVCESGSSAGSQDELEGNHLRDLSVFLFCQGHCLQWRHKGKNEDIHWVKILHKLFPS